MDERLWIHNAVIGLAQPSPPWPHPLHDVGFRLARIEQPDGTSAGEVSIDVLLLAEARNALLAVECKDGGVQERQANCYDAMTPLDVVQTGSVTVPDPANASLDVIYAVPEGRADATLAGLGGLRPGVLSIGSTIQWRGNPPNDSGLQSAFASGVATDLRAVPRLLPADDASPASAIAFEIANALHSLIEQRRESVTIEALVEQACWGWPRYGRAFKGALVRAVRDMLVEAAKDTLEGLVAVERAGAQSSATIRLIVQPTDASTQAGELRAARAARQRLDSFVAWATGKPVPSVPGQLEIEGLDLAVQEDEEDE